MDEQAEIDELLRQALEIARLKPRGIVIQLIVMAIEENITVKVTEESVTVKARAEQKA